MAIFEGNCRLCLKRCEIGPWLLWNVNRKSSMGAGSTVCIISMTLSDL